MAERRFSQAISEGDGISVVVEVADGTSAQAAALDGAEAVVVRGDIRPVREATELPILWAASGPIVEAARDGADACLVVVEDLHEDGDRLEQLHDEALRLGLDCVVEVRSEDELELALERLDPEIFLLSALDGDENPLDGALELLPDVPAGKLAIANVPVSGRDQVDELERAGVDAVIVGAGNVAALVGDAPPQV
jgi:indole-3-glycerol phosphate synthase